MKVKFLPQDIEVEIKPGQTIMSVAHENNIVIHSTCNGMPSCAECRVRIVDGDWNTNPPSRKELGLIGTGYYIDQRRLSCQTLCFGDVTVDTTEQSKFAEGPVTKKFLTKVHKNSAAESHSLGGVMIEQDVNLLQELKKDVNENVQPAATTASLSDRPRERQQNRGGGRNGGGGGNRGGGRGGGGGGGQNRGGGPRGGGAEVGQGGDALQAQGGNSQGGSQGEGGQSGGQGQPGGGSRRGGRGRRGGRNRR